jgi:hypothetical protein
VLGLGDEEAGDRLIVGAGEGVLEVELEGVLVLLLPLPPQFLRRHVDGHAKGPREWWDLCGRGSHHCGAVLVLGVSGWATAFNR